MVIYIVNITEEWVIDKNKHVHQQNKIVSHNETTYRIHFTRAT
jgi:hypothetical protein